MKDNIFENNDQIRMRFGLIDEPSLIKNILFIGANYAQELNIINEIFTNLELCVWIEAIPWIYEEVKAFHSAETKHRFLNACLFNKDDEDISFNVHSNQGGSSSIYPINNDIWKWKGEIKEERKVQMKSKTLNTLLKEENIDKEWDLIIIDVQGSEYNILSTYEKLDKCKYLITEISKEEIYKGLTTFDKYNQFLNSKALYLRNSVIPWHGDVTYKKLDKEPPIFISLGATDSVSNYLQNRNITQDLPFNLMVSSIDCIIKSIETDFADWKSSKDFYCPNIHAPNRKMVIKHRNLKSKFVHHITYSNTSGPINMDQLLDSSGYIGDLPINPTEMKKFLQMHKENIERFQKLLQSNRELIFIRWSTNKPSHDLEEDSLENILKLYQVLKTRCTNFKLYCFQTSASPWPLPELDEINGIPKMIIPSCYVSRIREDQLDYNISKLI